MFSLLKLIALAAFAMTAASLDAGPGSSDASIPTYTTAELYDMSVAFLDAFMAPNNTAQARSINSTVFAPDVIGRVDATRDFVGRELNTEYVFGLFSQLALAPGSFSLLGSPQRYAITHFAATQNIASLSNVVDFHLPALNLTSPIEILLWLAFDDKRQISQYDATFRYLQWQFDDLFAAGMRAAGVASAPAFQQLVAGRLAASICATAAASCTGANAQYASRAACADFLTRRVPFGSAYQLGFNTLLCRMVHQPMVPLAPGVHCPHIGPTGGAACVDDRTYAGTVREPLFTIQPFVPLAFANANATVAEE